MLVATICQVGIPKKSLWIETTVVYAYDWAREETTVKQVDPKFITLKVCDELYSLVMREAAGNNVAMVDVVVHALAEHFEREDLDYVPRRPQGRKPSDAPTKSRRAKQPA